MPWEKPLGKLLRLDLRADSAGGVWKTSYTAEAMANWNLSQTNNRIELDVNRVPRLQVEVLAHHRDRICQFIKPQVLHRFLKHILPHQCSTNENIVEIIRGAAKAKKLKLHRFLISPSYGGRFEAQKPRIIPERLVLDFINNKDPSLDPFNEWMSSRSCNWGTVAQKAASVSEE
ncbi:hypothetical protein NCS56_00390300 [Fusarium sp. Ph1]|nr:hypothetical protein NCS56_00390300 [Fusarium sp. Ph1]